MFGLTHQTLHVFVVGAGSQLSCIHAHDTIYEVLRSIDRLSC